MTERKFLITGATGDTGRRTTEILIEQGFAVRALVHRQDERSARLSAAGAEIVVGDLLNPDDARRALESVSAAYFVYPIAPSLIEATAYFAQAAKETGVGAVVNMSQISARREAKSHAARDHWIAERVFDWSGTPVTHLRPTFFAQWLLYLGKLGNRRSIVDKGVIELPLGEGRHAPLIAEILVRPTTHTGKVYALHGPIEMNQAAIAAAVGEVLGRKIAYQPITIPQFRERLESAGRSAFLTQHLCAVALDYQDGVFAGEDKVIAEVTGKAPMTVQEFVKRHWEAFKGEHGAG
jgi:NAD(P)H dehydrogenase (quinone)